MVNSNSFSFIIAYRHKSDRINNLRRVIDWVSGFGGVEIIIVEQDEYPKLPSLTFKGIKYIFTKSDMPFNKAWAFNVGLKYSTSQKVIFGDCDLIMDPNKMIESLKQLENYECVSPYSVVIDLDPNEVNMSLDQMQQISRPGRGETDIQKICLAGGIIMYRKDAIYKIGGWCEDFIGWGGEDDYQSHKSKKLLTHYESSGRCYHLWHHRGEPDRKWYPRTLELLNRLVSLSDNDLIKQINTSLPKIGLKNKYS